VVDPWNAKGDPVLRRSSLPDYHSSFVFKSTQNLRIKIETISSTFLLSGHVAALTMMEMHAKQRLLIVGFGPCNRA